MRIVMAVFLIGFLTLIFGGCTNVQHQVKLNKEYVPKEDLSIKVAKVVNDTGFTFDIDIEKMLADALEDQLFEKDLLWLGDKEPNLFMESRIIGSSSKLPMTPEEGLTELSIRCELKDDKDNFVGSVIASRKVAIGDLHAVDSWQDVIKSVASDVAQDIRNQTEAQSYVAQPKTLPEKTGDKPIAAFSPAKVNPTEPWTGEWKVEGSRWFDGTWVMKQSGRIVKTTKDSNYKFEGKVTGNQLKGKYKEDYAFYNNIVLNISSDGQSFEGTWTSEFQGRTGRMKGKRVK